MKKALFVVSCTLLGVAAGNFVLSLLSLLKKEQ
jgi:hypothetical protein